MKFLVIEGNIGAGKTTLSKKIAEEFKAKLILEQFEGNPFLTKFYKDSERYSFPLELSFLADRYKQIKDQILNADLSDSFLVADYYFAKTSIFARNTLKDDEYNLFLRIFNIIFESMPKPDLYVYLHASTNQLIKNIKSRGRHYEQNIEAGYLEKIQKGYFQYFSNTKTFPILVIDINGIDFLQNADHFQLLKHAICNSDYKLGLNRLIL